MLLIVAAVLTGCGGGGGHSTPETTATLHYPTGDPSCKEMVLGTGIAVSDYNDGHIYTINAPVLPSKPESNLDTPQSVPTYPFTITSAPATQPTGSQTVLRSKLKKGNNVYLRYRGQTEFDLKLRKEENLLLKKGTKQISSRTKGLAAAPATISVGTAWNDVTIALNMQKINTTCRRISSHAYFFVDNRDISTIEPYLDGYVTAFENIYQVNHQHFGLENDVDKNGKVIIIFSSELESWPGLLGYFNPDDKYLNDADHPDSNEGDIFYLTTYAGYQGQILYGTLAHEFQHMIYFDEHYNRHVTNTYTWLNEALSQAAEYYNGYLSTHNDWINSFLDDGWEALSLTYWTSSNYGYGAIFIRYLIDQYGDTAIKNMCDTGKVGIDAVEAATGTDFNQIFVNFTRSLVLSNTGISGDPRYNFISLDLKAIQPSGRGGLTTPYEYPAGESDTYSLYPYEINFDSWTGSIQSIKLTGTYHVGTVFRMNQ